MDFISSVRRGLTPPHRVKSISMATFSVHEIELLKFRGNSYCKKVWLGLCDDNRITEPKNELEIKEFMIEKYEKKRFYLEPCKSVFRKTVLQTYLKLTVH